MIVVWCPHFSSNLWALSDATGMIKRGKGIVIDPDPKKNIWIHDVDPWFLAPGSANLISTPSIRQLIRRRKCNQPWKKRKENYFLLERERNVQWTVALRKNHFRVESRNVQRVKSHKKYFYVKRKSSYSIVHYKNKFTSCQK